MKQVFTTAGFSNTNKQSLRGPYRMLSSVVSKFLSKGLCSLGRCNCLESHSAIYMVKGLQLDTVETSAIQKVLARSVESLLHFC